MKTIEGKPPLPKNTTTRYACPKCGRLWAEVERIDERGTIYVRCLNNDCRYGFARNAEGDMATFSPESLAAYRRLQREHEARALADPTRQAAAARVRSFRRRFVAGVLLGAVGLVVGVWGAAMAPADVAPLTTPWTIVGTGGFLASCLGASLLWRLSSVTPKR